MWQTMTVLLPYRRLNVLAFLVHTAKYLLNTAYRTLRDTFFLECWVV
jgi:hypothetical protein